ncbi:alpha/beta fold hydrolase [Cytobacillus horneckiae]|uniref:alpha/beta fold hydrolase n=1 Tax=Cytobacillus horneckiae TaxID=549687 RepID=UPI003D9AB143
MILHTEINGNGQPIVLIHSGGMTGETEYIEQSQYFEKRNYMVIRPDLRGHGQSVGSLQNYHTKLAEDLKETLDSLHIDKCHIAGVSLGGQAALLYAKKYPDRVKSLTFSGIFPVQPDNWAEILTEDARRFEESFFSNKEAVSYLNQIHGDNDWISLLRSFHEQDYPFHETGDVKEIQLPTMCIAGGDVDREFEAALKYKELNQRINMAIIPFAGHLVHRDQPQIYSSTLEAFLKQVES